MKKKWIIICLIMPIAIFYSFFSKSMEYKMPPEEKAVNAVMSRNSQNLAKKYHMRPFAVTVAMPEGDIQYLALEFQIQGPLPKNELRKKLIDAANDFLSDINSDSELRLYLKNHFLTIKDIGITLFLIDSSGRDLDDPDIGIAKISKGELEYDILITVYDDVIKLDIPKFKSITKESYEEALVRLNA